MLRKLISPRLHSRLLTAWEQLVVEHGDRSNVGRGDAKRASRDSRRSRVLASSRSFPTLSLDRNSDWIYNFFRVRDKECRSCKRIVRVRRTQRSDVPTTFSRESNLESRTCELRCALRRVWVVNAILVHFGLHEAKMGNRIVNFVFAVHWIDCFKD